MLEPNGKHVPATYRWCKDALTPDVDGTVVHVRHAPVIREYRT